MNPPFYKSNSIFICIYMIIVSHSAQYSFRFQMAELSLTFFPMLPACSASYSRERFVHMNHTLQS